MAEHPGVAIVDKFGGSVSLARQVTVGGEPADLYASADYEDIDVLLKPKWAKYTIRFAQGGMVLVYKINDPNPLCSSSCLRRRPSHWPPKDWLCVWAGSRVSI
jgi:ABC-type molybdate transport system substrate-binding protein